MLSDFLLIFYCWLLTSLWQVMAFPHISRYAKPYLYDMGWGISRVIGWLMIATPIWYIGHIGIPVNTITFVWLLTVGFVGYAVWKIRQNPQKLMKDLRSIKEVVIAEEVLFALGFFFLSIVRGFNPEVLGLEKFMDIGLIISYLGSPSLPIQDMWLAGYTFNYYTFGHYLGAIATHFWNISPYISYNVLLGLVMGLVLTLSFSVIANLLAPIVKNQKRKEKIIVSSGIIGAYVTTFGGNTHTIWSFFSKGLDTYWYPDASRFIINTIHEFPSYSFIVSDLHAHVWSMVLVFTLLTGIFVWVQILAGQSSKHALVNSSYVPISVLLGGLMGLIASTSTWDGLVYSLCFALLSAVLFFQNRRLFVPIVISGIVILSTMIISASPWWLNFESISEGVALVTERSPLWQLAVLWAGHLSVSIIAIGLIFRLLRKKANLAEHASEVFVFGMFLTAVILLIIPEFMYIIDIYPTQPRANTMFKLTYQSFILMSLIAGWVIGILQQRNFLPFKIQLPLFVYAMLFVLVVGFYPYFGYRDYYGALKTYRGLDGIEWLKNKHPSDYAAIIWLRETNDDQPHILEAVGDSYTEFARVSTYTGFPTVLGWRVHEWLWRGSYDIPGRRSAEVEKIYLTPELPESKQLLRTYQVKYIFLGDKEREAYPALNEAGLEELGEVVFVDGTTKIIQLSTL